MRRSLLTTLIVLISLSQSNAQGLSVVKLDSKPLEQCILKEFNERVANTQDKNIIFEKAFSICKPLEDGLILAYKMQGIPPQNLPLLQEDIREKTRKKTLAAHAQDFNTALWNTGYVFALDRCPGADTQYLGNRISDLMTEAQHMDAEYLRTKVIVMEVEYYRIIMEVQALRVGLEKWCQSERAFLEGQGVNYFFLKD